MAIADAPGGRAALTNAGFKLNQGDWHARTLWDERKRQLEDEDLALAYADGVKVDSEGSRYLGHRASRWSPAYYRTSRLHREAAFPSYTRFLNVTSGPADEEISCPVTLLDIFMTTPGNMSESNSYTFELSLDHVFDSTPDLIHFELNGAPIEIAPSTTGTGMAMGEMYGSWSPGDRSHYDNRFRVVADGHRAFISFDWIVVRML